MGFFTKGFKAILPLLFGGCFLLTECVRLGAQPSTPAGLQAVGYERHLELQWTKNPETNLLGYRIFRREAGQTDFTYASFVSPGQNYYLDFTAGPGIERSYRVSALSNTGIESAYSEPATAATRPMSDEELLTMVQAYTFRYFWDFAHPVSGLIRERNNSGETVTIGGSGFGVMAILVGIERGFITREEGLQRLLKIVLFLESADRFNGVFPHWMNGSTGKVIPFSTQDNGGDLVETAFLMQGLLAARQYFNGTSTDEVILQAKITGLWQGVNWDWYRNQGQNVLYWHWSPQHNFAINLPIRGWNEGLIVYLLAIASPTHGVPASLYHQGWAGGNYVNGWSYYGYPLDVGNGLGGPLFFTHYSFLGFDPRDKRDAYANYFIHNRNQTLVNRAYCMANPKNHTGYSAQCWGLTASDDPFTGYLAHEPSGNLDNGTIAPTAALSSMPYTPAESMDALKYFYRGLGDRLWGWMGFRDAFNLGANWFASSYLAIDQGPIICMIENYRTGLLWDHFMANPEIQTALEQIGFTPDLIPVRALPAIIDEWQVYPNPTADRLHITLTMRTSERVSLALLDTNGKKVFTAIDQEFLSAGNHSFDFSPAFLVPGVYFLQLSTKDHTLSRKVIITK